MALLETCLVFFVVVFFFASFTLPLLKQSILCVFEKLNFHPTPKMSREKTERMHSDQRISWFNQHPPSLFDSKRVFDAFLQQIAF